MAVGIRHGGTFSAARVAGGTGVRTGAPGADRDPPHLVHARDGPAARADLYHLYHRDAQRNSAAPDEPRGTRNFEVSRSQGLGAVEEAELCGGAAHVEGDHRIEPELLRDAPGEERTTARAGLHETNRETGRGLEGGHSAPGGHHEERALEVVVLERASERGQIALHQRLDVRVHDGGAEAVELPDLRTHLARQRHRQVRAPRRDQLPQALLVHGIGIAVEQPDRGGCPPRAARPIRGGRRARTRRARATPIRRHRCAPAPSGSAPSAPGDSPCRERCRTGRSAARRRCRGCPGILRS